MSFQRAGRSCHGHKSRTNVAVPTRVPVLDKAGGHHIVCIAGGTHHVLALRGDGTVYSWGRGHYGRLGHGPSAAGAGGGAPAAAGSSSSSDDATSTTATANDP